MRSTYTKIYLTVIQLVLGFTMLWAYMQFILVSNDSTLYCSWMTSANEQKLINRSITCQCFTFRCIKIIEVSQINRKCKPNDILVHYCNLPWNWINSKGNFISSVYMIFWVLTSAVILKYVFDHVKSLCEDYNTIFR